MLIDSDANIDSLLTSTAPCLTLSKFTHSTSNQLFIMYTYPRHASYLHPNHSFSDLLLTAESGGIGDELCQGIADIPQSSHHPKYLVPMIKHRQFRQAFFCIFCVISTVYSQSRWANFGPECS